MIFGLSTYNFGKCYDHIYTKDLCMFVATFEIIWLFTFPLR